MLTASNFITCFIVIYLWGGVLLYNYLHIEQIDELLVALLFLYTKDKDFEYVLVHTLSQMEQLPDVQKVNYIKQIRRIYKKKYIELWLQAHPYLWKLKCFVSKILHRMYDQIRK